MLGSPILDGELVNLIVWLYELEVTGLLNLTVLPIGSISVTSVPPGIPVPVTVQPNIKPVVFEMFIIRSDPFIVWPVLANTVVGDGNMFP